MILRTYHVCFQGDWDKQPIPAVTSVLEKPQYTCKRGTLRTNWCLTPSIWAAGGSQDVSARGKGRPQEWKPKQVPTILFSLPWFLCVCYLLAVTIYLYKFLQSVLSLVHINSVSNNHIFPPHWNHLKLYKLGMAGIKLN